MLNFRDDGSLYSSVDYGRFLICPRDKLQSVGSFVVPENMIDVFWTYGNHTGRRQAVFDYSKN